MLVRLLMLKRCLEGVVVFWVGVCWPLGWPPASAWEVMVGSCVLLWVVLCVGVASMIAIAKKNESELTSRRYAARSFCEAGSSTWSRVSASKQGN